MNVLLVIIILHGVDGDEIGINVDQITTLHPTKEAGGYMNQLIAPGHKCVVGLTNGKTVSVIESCATIRQAIKEAQK